MTHHSNITHTLAILMALVFWASSHVGCADLDDEFKTPSSTQQQAFTVSPSISLAGIERNNVHFERVTIGVGGLIFERADDCSIEFPGGPKSEGQIVTFDIRNGAALTQSLAPIELTTSGNYCVSLLIAPLATDNAAQKEGTEESVSILIEGLLDSHDAAIVPHYGRPKPVPWDNEDGKKLDGRIKPGLISGYVPFIVRSQTHQIKPLGGFKLSPTHSTLNIRLDLGRWVDDNLTPALARLEAADIVELVQISSERPVDLSTDLTNVDALPNLRVEDVLDGLSIDPL